VSFFVENKLKLLKKSLKSYISNHDTVAYMIKNTSGSGLLVLNSIQPAKLFTRLIGDSQPFWANPIPRCCPNAYKKEILVQWDSISI